MRHYFLSLCLLLSMGLSAQTTYYVSTTGDAANDGLSWASPKKFIKHVLAIAKDGDIIKVAQGSYVDGAESVVKNSVTIKGGFDPATGTQDYTKPSELTRINGNGRIMIFETAGKVLNLDNLAFSNAKQDAGAALRSNFGTMQTTTQLNITNCTFNNNTATGSFGAAIMAMRLPVKLSHCTFFGNNSTTSGAVFLKHSVAEVKNCLFYKNTSADDAPALYYYGTSLNLVNSTFAYNSATDAAVAQGGALGLYSDANVTSNVEISNSIFWGNTSAKEAGQIYVFNDIQLLLTSNIIQGGRSDMAVGARSAVNYAVSALTDAAETDPQFVNASADNYRLNSKSEAVDAGNNEKAETITTDLDGNARIQGENIDLGAYEFYPVSTGVKVVDAVTSGVSFDRASKTLVLDSNSVVNVYSANGTLVESVAGCYSVSLNHLATGIYIIEIGGRIVKIAL